MNGRNQQVGGRYYLDVKGGAQNGKRFEITPEGITAGRASRDDIVLPDGRISRHHARFYVTDGVCYVEDMGSRNGVLVDGKRTKKTHLKDGDMVDLGYCTMRLRDERGISDHPGIEEAGQLAAVEERPEVKVVQPIVRLVWHPLSIASLAFLLMAPLEPLFGLVAAFLAVLALRDIRRKRKPYGKVLAVVGLMLGLAVPAFSFYIRYYTEAEGAYVVRTVSDQCQQNLRMIYVALGNYATTHDGRYPASLAELADDLDSEDRLACPGCHRGDCTYMFPGARAWHDPKSNAVIVCDRSLGNHANRGGNVLRGNRQVEWLPGQELEPLLSRLAPR